MAEDRSWMYTGRQSRDSITPEWVEKTTEFVERAFRGVPPERQDFGMLCPCARCRNRNRIPRTKYEMQLDLGRNGFMPGYTVWVHHGEGHNPRPAKPSDHHPEENLDGNKDGAGGGEQVSKPQEAKKWEISVLEAYARGHLRKGTHQMEWSYQKYLWEQEKAKRQQQQSAPKAKRLERWDFGMLCPCARCRNRNRKPRTKCAMQLDLGRNGFMPGYTVWVHHGEGNNPKPAKPSDDQPEENLDGKKDGAGGGEQVSKPQGTNKREITLLEAYARSKLRKEDQIKWSYQKYLWEQEKIKQQPSAPKRLRTSAKLAEDELRNVSVPEPELEDTATSTADGPVANPATTANACGVQIPAEPTARPKRKTGPPGWHSGSDLVH